MRKRYLDTLGKEEALRKVVQVIRPIEKEEKVGVPFCRGRITSRPVRARLSNPPFVCAAMDGYAVQYERTLDADLTSPVALSLGQEEAHGVNTGDPVLTPMNAVIMAEDVEEKGETIVIRKPAYLWQHVRLIGEDVIEGDMLFPANYTLGILDLGLLLAGGVREVDVRKRPRLLVIPTGAELVDIYAEPNEDVRGSRLVDFNSYILAALGEEMGFEVTRTEIARDRDHLRAILTKHVPIHDVLVINAGSSKGTEDITEGMIREFGELIFHGVSLMPGKPTMFGLIEGKPVFGIPGYPVSAVISFKTFLQAAYERLCGSHKEEAKVRCVTPFKIPSSLGVEEVLRVMLMARDGAYYAYPLPRGAAVFSSLSRADGLINVPEHIEGYEEGAELSAVLLRPESELRGRLNIVGSHDFSLDVLRDMIKARYPASDLVSAHVGSLGGIIAVQKGIVDLATTHILDEQELVYNIPAAKRYLGGRGFLLVHIAKRMQGLLTARGNPKAIKNISDLTRKDVRFVNRQKGSGTRIVLDMMLKEGGIDCHSIQGYEREESTHAATAILVKEGIADTGLAIYPVSRIFSLDFVPLLEEEYDLLVTKEFSGDPRFDVLMNLLGSVEFASRLDEMGGYDTKESGRIKYVNG